MSIGDKELRDRVHGDRGFVVPQGESGSREMRAFWTTSGGQIMSSERESMLVTEKEWAMAQEFGPVSMLHADDIPDDDPTTVEQLKELVHHCVAHPFMGVAKLVYDLSCLFHDLTAPKGD